MSVVGQIRGGVQYSRLVGLSYERDSEKTKQDLPDAVVSFLSDAHCLVVDFIS